MYEHAQWYSIAESSFCLNLICMDWILPHTDLRQLFKSATTACSCLLHECVIECVVEKWLDNCMYRFVHTIQHASSLLPCLDPIPSCVQLHCGRQRTLPSLAAVDSHTLPALHKPPHYPLPTPPLPSCDTTSLTHTPSEDSVAVTYANLVAHLAPPTPGGLPGSLQGHKDAALELHPARRCLPKDTCVTCASKLGTTSGTVKW